MEMANINVSQVKLNTSTQAVKKTSAQSDNKGFTKMLKSATEEAKVQESSPQEKDIQPVEKQQTLKSKEIIESNFKNDLSLGELPVEAAEENDNGINEILELLFSLSGNADLKNQLMSLMQKGDMKEVKGILSELITGSLQTVKPDSLNNLSLLFTGEQITASDLTPANLKQLADNLTDKLASDSSFKVELGKVLQKDISQESGIQPETNKDVLKEVLIDKLSQMLKKQKSEDLSMISTDNTDSLEYSITGKENIQIPIQNISNEENASSKSSENFKDKMLSKEDKLLKNVLESKDKGSKDAITDKISSAVNRFENFRIDKAALVEEKPVITKANFNMDFIKAVKFMDVNSIKELSVKIIPKDLGEIVIRLTMDNGVMKANVTATNKDTYNLLNSQLQTISNQLSEQNMAIQSFSLSLSNGENFLFSGNEGGQQDGRQQGRGNSNRLTLDEDIVKDDGYSLDSNNVNLLA